MSSAKGSGIIEVIRAIAIAVRRSDTMFLIVFVIDHNQGSDSSDTVFQVIRFDRMWGLVCYRIR